ncbi:MAG: PD40 domain-containing protein [Verrucomicrobiaceae bacterium]|nr:PD40 domain-containing protein [Verrucomicrobiaceae bacterium]
MTRHLLFSFVALITAASGQTVAFQSETHIAVANLADAKPKARKLVEGADPSISPDGTKIAYTKSDAEGNRRIAIYDLATGKSNLVKGIEGQNEFGAIWSSDGKKLLFNHFAESDWSLASVSATGGGFQIVIDKGVRQAAGFAQIPGTSDWLCHDLEGFYLAKVDDSGAANLTDLPKDKPIEGLSMPAHLSISPDGKTALFDKSVDEETKPDDEGPPSAVFQIEIATGKITRVTPKGLHADGPSWLPGGKEFLFGSFDGKTQTETVHRMAIEPGSKPVQVLKKARNPSVASSEPVLTK